MVRRSPRDPESHPWVSSLVRRALRPDAELGYERDLPVFMVREDAPPITPEMVESALEDL